MILTNKWFCSKHNVTYSQIDAGQLIELEGSVWFSVVGTSYAWVG